MGDVGDTVVLKNHPRSQLAFGPVDFIRRDARRLDGVELLERSFLDG